MRPRDGDSHVVVDVSGVVRSFTDHSGVQRVLDGLDLCVEAGEIVAIAGRSGSGKTTLLTIIVGWEQPDTGSVTVLSADPASAPPSWRQVAIVPQSLGLLEELTVAENVALPLRLAPTSDGGAPGDLLDRLGLSHLAHRSPGETSLGEQQRAAVARAAVVRPRLLVADEPVAHQDTEWAAVIMQVLDDLRASGTACILASHNESVFGVADRVLQLRAGRLRPAGTV